MFGTAPLKLVGIIVGNIASNSPPLVYCLHCNERQDWSTEIITFSQYDTSLQIVKVLQQTLGQSIIDIWENENNPIWYYVQLDKGYPTHKIAYWSLPITVYFAQWKRLCAV